MTKRLLVKVVSASGLDKEAVFCELDFQEQKHKTKVLKGVYNWQQQFTLGEFNPNESLTVRFIAKRSGYCLGEYVVKLSDYYEKGHYDVDINIANTISATLELTVELCGSQLRRSSSMSRISKRLSKFISSTNVKKDAEESKAEHAEEKNERVAPSAGHIKHSQSDFELAKQQAPIKRNLSDEDLAADKHKRRERRQRRKKEETTTTKKDSESPDTVKKKRRRPRGEEEDATSNDKSKSSKLKESGTSEKRRDRKKTASTTVAESNDVQETPVVIEQAQLEIVKPDIEVQATTTVEIVEEKPKVLTKRTTVVLQPIGGCEVTHKLFGVPLEQVMERQKLENPSLNLEIPLFFYTSGNIIRQNGRTSKGIFRIRGRLGDVKKLKTLIDEGEPLKEDSIDNIHLIPTIMKAFLRELPSPILTFANYDVFMSCADLKGEEQIAKLSEIVTKLPGPNYQLLKFLFTLLYDLSLLADETQMTAENLAKVISPNLIWKEELDINDLSVVDDAMKGNAIAHIMIENSSKIFCL